MAVIEELIRVEDDGTISFGNYQLDSKTKKSDFEFDGDLYKVKTFKEITRLEKNGAFVYESCPGTAVQHFRISDSKVEFTVEGYEDSQVTLDLETEAQYEVVIGSQDAGVMNTGMGGKLTLSVELTEGEAVDVKVIRS